MSPIGDKNGMGWGHAETLTSAHQPLNLGYTMWRHSPAIRLSESDSKINKLNGTRKTESTSENTFQDDANVL